MENKVPEYTLIRSKRKTVELSLNRGGEAVVRAPLRYPKYKIDIFVKSRAEWLGKNRRKLSERENFAAGFSEAEIQSAKSSAEKYLRERTAYIAEQMSVSPIAVKTSNAKTRWGSCSHDNRINLNWRLLLCPPEVCDYLIIHELSHITHKNHSAEFWARVAEFCPDCKSRRKWLKTNGSGLMNIER
ncbi:MAG: M48 family metallopeptidase [Oscillospiraceae bacterium]|nr:M48 family metallopeptidase [Oscillospiraceae bacterium]